MHLRRLRAGEWILALSGVALFVSLFLPWYGDDLTAWEALAVNDVILAVIALGAVAVFVVTATQRVPAVPIALEAIVTLVAIFGVILVLVRTLFLPDGADGREWGLWLALASSIGLFAGGWLGVHEERVAGAPPPVEVEPLPAPRP